jgi:uncharacterized alpha-E superfamily protein
VTTLLARYGDCMFWLARYIERAENLARILDVQETFSRDSKGAHDWSVVLRINADVERFQKRHASGDSAAVLRFYVLDRDNPTSIVANLQAARENARALRPLISTEMWTQLNVFHNRVASLRDADIVEERLARVCAMIKEGCDAHTGITAGTLYRDEAWSFYEIGGGIECADQTTRLLDAKFLSSEARADVDPAGTAPGAAVDVSYWTALLRSAAGYQAFRRRHPRGMTPEQVALFLVCDPAFPRSIACNIGRVEEQLHRLRRQVSLRAAGPALEQLDAIRDDLALEKVRAVIRNDGLHGFNDWLQASLARLTSIIGRAFFGYPAEPAR